MIQPVHLKAEYLSNPISVQEDRPRLSWSLNASQSNAEKQTAYQIRAARSLASLINGEADCWDSGKVDSSQNHLVEYQGTLLQTYEDIYWHVRVWDAQDQASEWSEVAQWGLGPQDYSQWQADWITSSDNHEFETSENVTFLADDPDRGVLRMRPAKYFRKEFAPESNIRRATLYATARGLFEASINGQRIGDQYLTPGWTDYKKRLYYQSYDVTDIVDEKRPNAIGAILSDGWYAGYIGYGLFVQMPSNPSGRGYYGETPSLLMQLVIEYKDGTRQFIGTDTSWQTSTGPITETDILMGESYDARKEMPGWNQPDFDASSWEPVASELPYTGELQAHPGVPVRVTQRLQTQRILNPEPGVYIFDLGQNFSGIPELKIKGKAGQKIKLRTAEMIRPDNSLLTANLRCARSTDTYILKGSESAEVWSPQFVYHGFQYIEVTGLENEPTPDMITGLVLHSDTPLTGSFECSDPMLNQLYSNILWTQRSNFVEVPTDCPQRDERLGWTGDAQIYIKAATYGADTAAFFKKWLIDLHDSQWDYGAYPSFSPRPFLRPGFGHGVAWMDAGVICPWTVWQTYGDLQAVEGAWKNMEIFMRFREVRDPKQTGSSEGQDWGDWLNLDQETPLEYIDLCYYAYCAKLMASMAAAIGKDQRHDHYTQLFANLQKSFLEQYREAPGVLNIRSQTAYALALFMELIPEDQIKATGQTLADLIAEDGNRMATGFIGTRPLLPALTMSGQHELAGKLLQSQEYPSWGYEVKNGATSIWERWNSYIKGQGASDESMNSFSHYAFGAVSEWMFQNLVGIDLIKPGWTEFSIAPRPTQGITWVNGSYNSPQGLIEVKWSIEKQIFKLSLTVPVNTIATLELPLGIKSDPILVNSMPLVETLDVKEITPVDGKTRLKLNPGTYQLVSKLESELAAPAEISR